MTGAIPHVCIPSSDLMACMGTNLPVTLPYKIVTFHDDTTEVTVFSFGNRQFDPVFLFVQLCIFCRVPLNVVKFGKQKAPSFITTCDAGPHLNAL
jgi:hypothetical protein